jgi:hypothetical protein
MCLKWVFEMIIKEMFRAKAPGFRMFNNHGLKAVVIDNEQFMDFSPKFLCLIYTLIPDIRRHILFYSLKPILKISIIF